MEDRLALAYAAAAAAFEAADLVPGGAGVTAVLTNSADNFTAINLGGSTASFFGVNYGAVFVSDNGLVTFGSGTAAFTNSNLSSSPAQAAVATLWDDWTTNRSPDDQVLYRFDDLNADTVHDRLIVEWNMVRHFNFGSSTGNATFQAILQLNTAGCNGAITFNYLDLVSGNSTDNGASATVGINAAGTFNPARVLVSFNAANALVGSGQAIKLSEACAAVTANAGLDQLAIEGNEILFDGSGSSGATSYSWNFGDGTTGSGVNPTHVYADDGNHLVTLTASDTMMANIMNATPTFDAGDDQSIDEGGAVSFDGLFNDRGTLDTHTATINGGDGSATEAGSVSETPFGPPGSVDGADGNVTGSHSYGDNGDYAVQVCVADDDNASACDVFMATVNNVAPSASIAGPTDGVRGQELSFTLNASDVSAAVQAAGFDYAIDWDGDGTVDQTVSGPDGMAVAHVYSDAGSYTAHMTATDKDGGQSAEATHAATIHIVLCQDGVMVVGGSTGDDRIVVKPGGKKAAFNVFVNRQKFAACADNSLVVVYAQAGNDVVRGAGGIDVAMLVYGGDGDDRIKGGRGDDVLLGEAGNDQLRGGSGRDILIGGSGADRLEGSCGDDLLIAGTTEFDNDEDALMALRNEWMRRDAGYSDRIDHLMNGGGLNGAYLLNSSTAHDDDAADSLVGASGADWFVGNFNGAGVIDILTKPKQEMAADL